MDEFFVEELTSIAVIGQSILSIWGVEPFLKSICTENEQFRSKQTLFRLLIDAKPTKRT